MRLFNAHITNKELEKEIDKKYHQRTASILKVSINKLEKAINNIFDQKFAEQDARLQKQFEKHDYEISVLENKSNHNTRRIGALKQKVFGVILV